LTVGTRSIEATDIQASLSSYVRSGRSPDIPP
jgi:hypothetical protein